MSHNPGNGAHASSSRTPSGSHIADNPTFTVDDDIDMDNDFGHDDDNHLDFMDDAIHLESKFYNAGYESGKAHGRLHGLFEGRQLGQEKAWEIWEEVGFYEGFATVWIHVLLDRSSLSETIRPTAATMSASAGRAKGKEARSLAHAKTLVHLIAGFPTTNPTPVPDPPIDDDDDDDADANDGVVSLPVPPPAAAAGDAPPPPADLSALLSNIRARYRLLCASLGVRPRLVAASAKDGTDADAVDASGSGGGGGGGGGGGVVEGVEGPMKGVDTRQLKF